MSAYADSDDSPAEDNASSLDELRSPPAARSGHLLSPDDPVTRQRGQLSNELGELEDLDVVPVPPTLQLDPTEFDGLSGRVLPQQANEFVCSSCFLVLHVSRRSAGYRCTDCD